MLIIKHSPARLLCRMTTAILKRDLVVGSIYVPKASFEVRVPQPWNLPLTGLKPERVPQPWNLSLTCFEPALLKVPCDSSCLS